jgi:hypothetical protein
MFTIILLLLLTFTGFSAINAQTIYEHSDTLSYDFKYVPFERSENNKVLNQLALAHLKVPEKTSFKYSFRYRVTVNYSHTDSLYLYLDVTPIGFKGDVKVKDFSIEKLLEPSGCDVIINLEKNDGNRAYHSRRKLVLDDGMILAASFPDSLWSENIKVDVGFISLLFTEEDYRQIELELVAIRNYYAAAEMVDTLQHNVRVARKKTENLDQMVGAYFNGIKGASLVRQVLDTESETVPGADPLDLREKVRLLDYHLSEYADFIRNGQFVILKGNACKNFAVAYMKSLKDAAVTSQHVDYYSSPFFYKLYSNSVSASRLSRMGNAIETELKRRGIGRFDKDRLVYEVLKEYKKESERLIKENRFLESVDLLTGAQKIVNLTNNTRLSREIEEDLTQARKGLVYSYTTIIERALDMNMVSLASKYIAEVSNYTSRLNLTNTETSPFRDVYIRMAGIRIQMGNNFSSKGDYNSALNEFMSAIELINGESNYLKKQAEDGLTIAVRALYNDRLRKVESFIDLGSFEMAGVLMNEAEQFALAYSSFYTDKAYADTLKGRIAKLQFDSLLAGIRKGNNTESGMLSDIASANIARLLKAADLTRDYIFPVQPEYDTLVMDVGYPYIRALLSRGRLKYWASEPDSALMYAQQASNLMGQLQLNSREDLNDQYRELLGMANETYCNQAKGEYNSLLQQTRELFELNKISEGLVKSNKVREHVYKFAGCDLNTNGINSLLNEYRNTIRWQNLITDAFARLDERAFMESANLVQQAESVYSFYRLDTLGIANIGYYDLALESDDIPMLRHAVMFLVNKGKPDDAMKIMERMRLKGYPAGEAADMQETLGRIIATRDKEETPDLNVKLMVRSYTGDISWYGRFEQVYKYYTRPEKQEGGVKDILNILKF